MPNTSATGGPILPSSSSELEGVAFEDFLHDYVVALTGLANEVVFPRWQPEPVDIPQFGTDWCAIGLVSRKALGISAAVIHGESAGVGYDETRRHEDVTIMSSFYGPNSDSYAAAFRENLQLAQNREVLQNNNIGLVETQDLMTVPELIKQRWLRRVDMNFVLRRQIVRRYSVLSLASFQGTLNNERQIVALKS